MKKHLLHTAGGFSLHATIAASSMALAIGLVGFVSFANIQSESLASQLSLVSCAHTPQPPAVVGVAGYVLDLASGEALYEKNALAQLPLASITKIMTGIVALDTLREDAVVTIPHGAFGVEGSHVLLEGERWRVGDLLNVMLITSSNHAARALALLASEPRGETIDAFIVRMNERAQNADLVSMYFLNETGLDTSEVIAGGYGSARDVAHLFAIAAERYKPVAAASTDAKRTLTSESGFTRTAEHTSALLSTLPGVIAVKTGYTDLAGGNLAVIVEPVPGRPVAVVILGSTREARHTDVLSLTAYAQRLLRMRTLCGI